MKLTDRMTVQFELDKNPTIGRILERQHSSLVGPGFTSQREIIANSQPTSDMVVVTFMQGFRESCPWNNNHGKRFATEEEKSLAQAWLNSKMLEFTRKSN